MAEYIEREFALDVVKRTSGDYAAAFAEIAHEPASEVVPVKRGMWIVGDQEVLGSPIHCSECGWGSDRADQKKWMKYPGHKFCGACGALMEGCISND